MKNRTITCPLCNGKLRIAVKTEGNISKSINKDGTISKRIRHVLGYVTDVYFLQCEDQTCGFIYNLSHSDNNDGRTYRQLDEWYENNGDAF